MAGEERKKVVMDALEGLASYVEEVLGGANPEVNEGIQKRILMIMAKIMADEEYAGRTYCRQCNRWLGARRFTPVNDEFYGECSRQLFR